MANHSTRRSFLQVSGAAMLAGAQVARAAPPKRPNLVLYQPETLRAESLGLLRPPRSADAEHRPLRRRGRPIRAVPRAEHRVRSLPMQPDDRVARSCARPSQPVLFPQPEEPNLFRYLKQNGYDVLLVRQERFAGAGELCLERYRMGSETCPAARPDESLPVERSPLLLLPLRTCGRPPRYGRLRQRAGGYSNSRAAGSQESLLHLPPTELCAPAVHRARGFLQPVRSCETPAVAARESAE